MAEGKARSGRRAAIGVSLAASVAMVSGCGFRSAAERSADQHATNAAVVMGRFPMNTSARQLAASVVGQGRDDHIEVYVAQGTKLHGTVLLRIAVVVPDQGFKQGSRAVRCYRYMFDLSFDEMHPSDVSCPAGRPLKVG